MTLDEKSRQALIDIQLEKCRQAADDARFSLDNDRLFMAANRIYYAIFYLVSAIALKNGFKTNKHLQLMDWFNREFVKPGRVDKRWGKIYRKAFSKRQEGDYSDMITFDKDELERLYDEMMLFVVEIETLLNS